MERRVARGRLALRRRGRGGPRAGRRARRRARIAKRPARDGRAGRDRRWGMDARCLPLVLRPRSRCWRSPSVALQPAYPYAFTLPVALTQDWGIAQDLLALAAVLAATLKAPRFPAPRAVEVFGLCFVVYAALVPEWAWQWDSHPGNEPKTLRQAVALGHWLTFDAEAVSGPMETLGRARSGRRSPPRPPRSRASRARCSRRWRGARRARTRSARLASRVRSFAARRAASTPSSRPVPRCCSRRRCAWTARINRARGVEGRVAVSVLFFCALGAWLVAALFLLLRDATGRPGLAAALSFFLRARPALPLLFPPVLPGDARARWCWRSRSGPWRSGPSGSGSTPCVSARSVAVLPWLHQKFLPVWGVLLATALVVGWRRPQLLTLDRSGWKWAALLLAPNAREPVPHRLSTTSRSPAASAPTRSSSPGVPAA